MGLDRGKRVYLAKIGRFGVWAGHHKAKSPYLAEIGRFRGLGRPSKIALSRRDRTILGFGQAYTEENVPISPR